MTDRSGKKTKKKNRGKRTHGRGNTKHGRGKGSRKGTMSLKGGRNFDPAVREKIIKEEKGFKSHKPSQKGINLRDINTLIEEDQKEVNVLEHGYDKVLSSGEIQEGITVKARDFSEKAEEKIEESGGEAVKV